MTATVLEKLKEESLRLRRDMGMLAKFSVFAISEIEKVGKNAGNRPTTNDEAIVAVKKMISTIDSNMAIVADGYNLSKLAAEKRLLESVLPQMIDIEEVRMFLLSKWLLEKPTKGDVMKEVKANFGALVDMKQVGQLATELYGV